jgi:hypothetical protein
VAHVAFAHDAAFGVELRHRIGAVPDAILAADAGVRRVENDAGDGAFRVGVDGTAFDAVGAKAVVRAHREVEAVSIGVGATFGLADATPAEIGGVAVLFIAGDLAGAAADALGHVEVKAVLLARRKGAIGNESGLDLYLRQRDGKEFQAVLRQTHEMSLVSATTEMAPPLSKATLNFRGSSYMSFELEM